MNLFRIIFVVTWACLFVPSMVVEAIRGQKQYSECTLWHSNSMFGSFHSPKSQILEPRPKVMISDNKYLNDLNDLT